MTLKKKARAVGINHIALEVGDIDTALEFYGSFLDFELRGKHDTMAVRHILEEMGVEIASDRFLDFYDPWGNRIEIVGYEGIQFTKADNVLLGMGLDGLSKTSKAFQELADKGMAPGKTSD